MREWRLTVTDAHPHPGPAGDALDAPGVAAATGGRIVHAAGRPIHGAAVDSRRVEPGQLFVALPGERTDGHGFLEDAVGRGAAALLVTEEVAPDRLRRILDAPGGVSVVRVGDGVAALQALAAAWRARYSPLVVGVTGSLAKTSTKEAAAAVLGARWTVLKNTGNENNEIGLPLTLLRLGRDHQAAVLEMGQYVPGDIALLAEIARPAIGVVTAVRAIHLERAGTIEEIARGKAQLVEALPSDGTAVLNADDPRVAGMASLTGARVVRYGYGTDAIVGADDVADRGLAGMRFTLVLPGARRPVRLPVLGRHGVQNALAAAAAGYAAGLLPDEIVAGLERGWSAPHRDQVREIGGWRILDDSYNAAPDSMAAALDLLGTLPGRRIAVLGEMLELGPEAEARHREVGTRAAARADLLVAVGEGGRSIADGARAAGMAHGRVLQPADRDAAVTLLLGRLERGDTVLVKASRGLGMDAAERSTRGLGLDELIDTLELAVGMSGGVAQ